MKTRFSATRPMRLAILVVLLVATLFCLPSLRAQGTAFIYQGRLQTGGQPANGGFDFRFALFMDANAATQSGPTLANKNLAVTDGVFSVTLDFGAGVFSGSNLWLQIGVRTNGDTGPFMPLSPLQSIQSVPYAVTAGNLTGPISGNGTEPVASAMTNGDDFLINATNSGANTWTTKRISLGDLLNSFAFLNLTNQVNWTNNVNSSFKGAIYGSGAPLAGLGTPYFKNGYFGFLEDSGGDYQSGMFFNTLHGGAGNRGELQWSFNQMAYGTDIDGGHVQMGHIAHSNEWFYLERGIETGHRDDNNYFGHSHFFGWQYSWATNSSTGIGFWWTAVTNLDRNTGRSRWELFGPTGNPSQNPGLSEIGPTALTVGQDGTVTPGQRFVDRLTYPGVVGVTNVFINYTNARFQEIDISAALNLIETNLGLNQLTLLGNNASVLQTDLIIVPGFVNRPLLTPAAWQWESENGTVIAPTNVPANTKMHIRLLATLGVSTNVYAYYTLIPYTPVVDGDATGFLSAGNITDSLTKSAINIFVIAAKAHGYWSHLFAGYPFVGGTSNSCSWNIVNTNLYRIAWHGRMTYDLTGITGDGSTAYGDTGLIPSAAASGDLDTFAGCWLRGPSVPLDQGYFFGVTDATPNRWGAWRDGSNFRTAGMNNAPISDGGFTSGGNFAGFMGQRRIGPTSEQLYFNSIPKGATTGRSAAVALPGGSSIYVLARNQSGPDNFSNANLSSCWMGENLSAQNVTDLINDLTALNNALGR